jgi:hypothetical protein
VHKEEEEEEEVDWNHVMHKLIKYGLFLRSVEAN